MATVSIIIPCYNKAKYLSETLDSVLAQTFRDWECIIINDGSIDETEIISKRYIALDKRFKYFYQSNQGVSASRNNGIANSSGYYILPLDADDTIDKTYIEKAICHFEYHPETKLVYCKADKIGIESGPYYFPEYTYENLIWKGTFHNSCLFRKSDFDKTHGYNTNMKLGYEDYDFWLSLIKPEDIVYQINEILFHYRILEESRNTTAFDHRNTLLIQIYHNHEDIYAPYAERIIIEHRLFELEHNHAMEIYNTSAYKLGHFILQPFVILKKIAKRLF